MERQFTYETRVLPVTSLIPSPYNPRVDLRPGDSDFEALMRSIERWGIVDPIIWNETTGRVVGGHQRIVVAEHIGMTELPVSVVRIPEEDEKALNIALNKIGGAFDQEKLADLLRDLREREFDITLTGFNGSDLDALLAEMRRERAGTGSGRRNYNEGDDTSGEGEDGLVVSEPGDIWILGRHRLMCGDSTCQGHVDKLLAGDRVDQVLTDPPYGCSYEDTADARAEDKRSKSRPKSKIENDRLSREELHRLFAEFFAKIPFAQYNTVYVFMSDIGSQVLRAAAETSGLYFSTWLVWTKNQAILSRADYNRGHELILYGWKGKHKFHGDTKAQTVLPFDKVQSADLHPTMKPVPLLERLLRDGSPENAIVYDGFTGSGSTLIACETQSRIFRGMEIDPVYLDRAVRRWQHLTGEDARMPDGTKFNHMEEIAKARNSPDAHA